MVDGKVYIIKFSNGKSYIGVTIQKLRVRIMSHIWNAKNGSKYFLYNAMRKYDYKFELEVIAECNDWEELMELEKRLIIEYGTKYPNGYNMADGGRGTGGVKHTEDRKIKTAKSLKKSWADNYESRKKATRKAVKAMNDLLKNPIAENKRRAKISLTMKNKKIGVGEKNKASKLTVIDVLDIRKRIKEGEKDKAISEIYRVDRKLINMIRNGKRWASVNY